LDDLWQRIDQGLAREQEKIEAAVLSGKNLLASYRLRVDNRAKLMLLVGVVAVFSAIATHLDGLSCRDI
jgi:hypothetical protein